MFHYFESKLGVYGFVYDYSVRYLLLELSTTVDSQETDLFTLIQQVETGKMHACCSYPYLQQFLNRAQSENVSEALLAVEERKRQMEDYFTVVFDRADLGKYASAEDAGKLHKMLELTIRGLMNERILEDAFQPEMLYEEILEYLNLSRRLLSQNETHSGQ